MDCHTVLFAKDSLLQKYSLTLQEFDVLTCWLTGKNSKTSSYFLERDIQLYRYDFDSLKKKLKISSMEDFKGIAEDEKQYHYCHSYVEILLFEKKLKNVVIGQKFSKKKLDVFYGDKTPRLCLDILERHLSLFNVDVRCVLNPKKVGESVLSCEVVENDDEEFNPCSLEILPLRLVVFNNLTSYTDFFENLIKKLNISDDIMSLMEGMKQDNVDFTVEKKEKIGFDFIIFILFILFSSLYGFFEFSKKNQLLCRGEFPIISPIVKRNSLFLQLEKMLEYQPKGDDSIKYVILSGIRGSGKTTLARLYARKSKCDIVWEINGQTPQTLAQSFYHLAFNLAKTPIERDEISLIEKIVEPDLKNERLIAFVQKFLKKSSSWLLIFNKVKGVSTIENFLPSDSKHWGKGACIIIKTKKNFKKNIITDQQNFIYVYYLQDDEALKLFSQVYYKVPLYQIPRKRQQDIKEFLKHVPLYPLDIILAANEARRSKLPLQQYLYKLCSSSNCIFDEQIMDGSMPGFLREKLLCSIFNYLAHSNHSYRKLLFLISFLNANSVPKSFLLKVAKENIVENFIKTLKKYAVIFEYKISENGALVEMLSFNKSFQEFGSVFFKKGMHNQELKFLIKDSLSTLKKHIKKTQDNDNNGLLLWMKKLEDNIKFSPELNS